MKSFLAALLLSVTTFVSAQVVTIPPDPTCAPSTPADVRAGNIDSDLWFYWWCRDPDHVWLVWQGYLSSEMKQSVANIAIAFAGGTGPINSLITFGPSVDRPETAHLKAAVLAAAALEVETRPQPGPPFPQPTMTQLWNVTPNGASPTRRTNLVEGGKVVPKYGTQTVRVLAPCDCSVVSFPEGSVTKKCPVAGKMVTEVISCMRLR